MLLGVPMPSGRKPGRGSMAWNPLAMMRGWGCLPGCPAAATEPTASSDITTIAPTRSAVLWFLIVPSVKPWSMQCTPDPRLENRPGGNLAPLGRLYHPKVRRRPLGRLLHPVADLHPACPEGRQEE